MDKIELKSMNILIELITFPLNNTTIPLIGAVSIDNHINMIVVIINKIINIIKIYCIK